MFYSFIRILDVFIGHTRKEIGLLKKNVRIPIIGPYVRHAFASRIRLLFYMTYTRYEIYT